MKSMLSLSATFLILTIVNAAFSAPITSEQSLGEQKSIIASSRPLKFSPSHHLRETKDYLQLERVDVQQIINAILSEYRAKSSTLAKEFEASHSVPENPWQNLLKPLKPTNVQQHSINKECTGHAEDCNAKPKVSDYVTQSHLQNFDRDSLMQQCFIPAQNKISSILKSDSTYGTYDSFHDIMKFFPHKTASKDNGKFTVMEFFKKFIHLLDDFHSAADRNKVSKQNNYMIGIIKLFIQRFQKIMLSSLENDPYYDVFKNSFNLMKALMTPNLKSDKEINESVKIILRDLLKDDVSDEVKAEIINVITKSILPAMLRGEELKTVEEKKKVLNGMVRLAILAYTGKPFHKDLLTGNTEKELTTEVGGIFKYFLQMHTVILDILEMKKIEAIPQGCINGFRSIISQLYKSINEQKKLDSFERVTKKGNMEVPSAEPTLAH